MFGRKRESAEITPGDPQFTVRYVGQAETWVGSARGCTSTLVQRIWDNSEEERRMKRYSMLVIPTGIVLQDLEKKKRELKFDIKCISHYSAEKGAHDRVFAWIYQDPGTQKLFCHAVLCTQRERAQQAAVVLSKAMHIAYKDWKGEKIRTARKSEKLVTQTRQKSITDTEGEVNFNFHFEIPAQVVPASDGNEEACANSHESNGIHSNRSSRSSSVNS